MSPEAGEGAYQFYPVNSLDSVRNVGKVHKCAVPNNDQPTKHKEGKKQEHMFPSRN